LIWTELDLAIRTLFRPPYKQKESNQPNELKERDEGIETKRKKSYIFISLPIIGESKNPQHKQAHNIWG